MRGQGEKLGIVTIFDNINFGTYLQVFATAWHVERCGLTPLVIDYRRANSSLLVKLRELWANGSYSRFEKALNLFGALVLVNLGKRRFRRFVSRRFQVTGQVFSSESELREAALECEAFMAGSDQIWNFNYNDGFDPVYFLSFTDAPKMSFASSLGMEAIPVSIRDPLRLALSRFSSLSVRERSSIRLLADIGVRREIQHVLDPTMLLDKRDWLDALSGRRLPGLEADYLLIYSVEAATVERVRKQAASIAKARGLKTYLVTAMDPLKARAYGADRVYSFATPEDFIQLFAHARYAIVSSFHGTAFAINFNVPFVAVAPELYPSRVTDLLDLFSLRKRLYAREGNPPSEGEAIDWAAVNQVLRYHRQASLSYLRSSLLALSAAESALSRVP